MNLYPHDRIPYFPNFISIIVSRLSLLPGHPNNPQYIFLVLLFLFIFIFVALGNIAIFAAFLFIRLPSFLLAIPLGHRHTLFFRRLACEKFLQLHLVLHLLFVIAIIIDGSIILFFTASQPPQSPVPNPQTPLSAPVSDSVTFYPFISVSICDTTERFYANFSCKLLLMHFECNLCFVCRNWSGAHKNS